MRARLTAIVLLLGASCGAPRVERARVAEPAPPPAVDVAGALEVYWQRVALDNRVLADVDERLALYSLPLGCWHGEPGAGAETLRAAFEGGPHETRPFDVEPRPLADGGVEVREWVVRRDDRNLPARVEPRVVRLHRVADAWRITSEATHGASCDDDAATADMTPPPALDACIAQVACGDGQPPFGCMRELSMCLGAGPTPRIRGSQVSRREPRPAPSAGECSADGWCVVSPSSGLWPMRAVSGLDDEHVWAGGVFGLARYDGRAWARVPAVDFAVVDILAAEDGRVFASGYDEEGATVLVIRDPTSGEWARVALPPALQPGRTLDSGRVLAAGPRGRLWALSRAGTVAMREGGRWVAEPSLTDRRLNGAAATGGGLLAFGDSGTLLRRDEQGRWARQMPAPRASFFTSVRVDGELQLYGLAAPQVSEPGFSAEQTRMVRAVMRARGARSGTPPEPGARFDEHGAFVEPTPEPFVGVAQASDGLWAVGEMHLWHRSDGDWRAVERYGVDPLRAIWAHGETVVAVGDAGALVRRGGAWSFEGTPRTALLASVARGADGGLLASGDRVLLAVAPDGGVQAETSRELSSYALAPLPGGGFLGVHDRETRVLGREGPAVRVETAFPISELHRVGERVFGVVSFPAESRGIYAWEDAAWRRVADLPEGRLVELRGPERYCLSLHDPDYRYRVECVERGRRRVLRETGSEEVALWRGGRSIVLVGQRHTHVYDGRRWRDIEHPHQSRPARLVGSRPDALFAPGSGAVRRFDGEAWHDEALPPHISVGGLLEGPDAIWAVGSHATVLRRDAP